MLNGANGEEEEDAAKNGWMDGQNEIQRRGETRQTDRETNDGLDPIPGRSEWAGG